MSRVERVFIDTNELFPFTVMDVLLAGRPVVGPRSVSEPLAAMSQAPIEPLPSLPYRNW